MTEYPNTREHLAALAELDPLLGRHDVAYWVFGGWAVDFHAGRLTREHGDIDIAVWADDRELFAELLSQNAWTHSPDIGEDGYTCYERNGIRLEVAFLARDERGGIYTPLIDGRGEWPHDSFGDAIAQLGAVTVHVVSRDSLIADKSVIRADATTAAKDSADITTLLRVDSQPGAAGERTPG